MAAFPWEEANALQLEKLLAKSFFSKPRADELLKKKGVPDEFAAVVGAAFSGKYKSVFVANQGSKQKRLDALLDGIAEVYASTFGSDPIEYRAERGLMSSARWAYFTLSRGLG